MISLARAVVRRETLVALYNLLKSTYQKLLNLYPLSLLMSGSNNPGSSETGPPPFDPYQPSVPVSFPLTSLQQLESRSYFDCFHYPFNKSSFSLRWDQKLPDRQRILVCHDMKGGYADDKWVQGCKNDAAFAIWEWGLIDLFVYFSHSLVTLPPPCWTNTAHRHGVKVLGTFITEWDVGKAICDTLLATKESAHMYAERLSELADALGFDGWLINLENKVDEALIPNLKEFIDHLTETMHASVPGSLVIWYDSVTIHGDLKWQNQLNENNQPFFDICDGIFMNYTWKEDYPKLSADVAGERRYDVYMGIDVFGRGTYGGGQWNTNIALDVLKKSDVSAAIFAPGWVLETEQPPNFHTAQDQWWKLIKASWMNIRSYPKVLPFYSNFDQGYGYHISIESYQVLDAPWYNLSCQSLQPIFELTNQPSTDTIEVSVDCNEASYDGGGNVTFKGCIKDDAHLTMKLFQCELLLPDTAVWITYSVKPKDDSLLGILLHLFSPSNERKLVLLASGQTNQLLGRFSGVTFPCIKSQKLASGWTVEETSIQMDGYTLTEIYALCYRPESGVSTPTDYFALLGHITIKISQNICFPPASSWIIEVLHNELNSDPDGGRAFCGMLQWKLKDGNNLLFPKYNIYLEKFEENKCRKLVEKQRSKPEFLGAAHVNAYYVSDLKVPWGINTLTFLVQACADDGSCQCLGDSPSFKLNIDAW